MWRKPLRLLRNLLPVLLLFLGGCVSHNYAPVQDLERPDPVMSGSHQVNRGETLYSIAWRYGRDYRDLARINNIRYPYLIKPGQRLYLSPRRSGKSTKPANTEKPATVISGTRKPAPTTAAKSVTGSLKWRWPLKGKLVGRYAAAGGRGIDIEANGNSQVRAAADGVVVYAGDGLIGYGNLLIIKHNDVFLSAYAHNHRLLVKEQQAVKVGQKIAEILPTGKKNRALHFEIRKDGKPVDPLGYLPRG